MVVFEKGRIGIDVDVVPFAQNQLARVEMQRRMKVGAGGALYAMVRPEDLRPVWSLDIVERPSSVMTGGEREMPGRMPVLSEYYVIEFACCPVDWHDYSISMRNSKRPTRTEVILHIDNDEYILGCNLHVLP